MRRPLLALVLALTALPVAAAAPQEREGDRLRAEYRDEQARARRLRAEADQATLEIAALERRLQALRSAAGTDDKRIGAQRARLSELSTREAALAARLSTAQGREARLLSALQTMSRHPPPPLLVPSERAVNTVRASILLRAVAPEMRRRTRVLESERTELSRVRRLAALNSEALFTTDSARGDRRAEIETLTARQTALRAVLTAEAAAAERAAAVLEARLRTLGLRPPVASEPEPASAPLPAGRARLTVPVDGAPSARFGRGSNGWSWRADRRTAVAPAQGRVVYVGPLSGWGQVVILDLGPGWRGVVAGLEETQVRAGDRVADGQPLGRSGTDGEIHFELRRDERPIDPAPFLN